MTEAARLVVVGSLNCDVVVRVATLPTPGETILGQEGRLAAGGKGLNQAVAAAAAGAAVSMIGTVGRDAFGARLLDHARRSGIDCRFVGEAPDALSGIATITVSADGANMIAVAPGANAALTPAMIDDAHPTIAGARALLVQLETPFDAVRRALGAARAAGATTILNPAPADPRALDLCALADVLTPNEHELALLSGVTLDGGDETLRQAMAVLHAAGAGIVVATLGGAGCAVLADGAFSRVPAFSTTVVDTTGAGDTFSGVLAASFAEGAPLAAALRRASAAGAIAVSRASAEGAAPSRDEIDAFLEAAA